MKIYTDEELANNIRSIITKLNTQYKWDMPEEDIKETPERIVKMFGEFNSKRNYDKFKTFKVEAHGELIILKDMEFYSLCSHHFLPFFGIVTIAYLPSTEVVGVSKLSRIVSSVSLKPSLQEKVGIDIADKIEKVLNPEGLMVLIKARHMCMMMRGVRDSPEMITSVMRGSFLTNEQLKMEVLGLIK